MSAKHPSNIPNNSVQHNKIINNDINKNPIGTTNTFKLPKVNTTSNSNVSNSSMKVMIEVGSKKVGSDNIYTTGSK